MTGEIKNVLVAGASGNAGPYILSALLSRGFTVTALVRSTSTATFSPSIRVLKTDYSLPSLLSALEGQHAVINAVNMAGLEFQNTLIEASLQTGVKRFVPSEFGIPADMNFLPEIVEIMREKMDAVPYLEKAALENPDWSYSSVSPGNWVEWALTKVPLFGFDLKNRSVEIMDSGDKIYCGSSFEAIGIMTAELLLHPEETANRNIAAYSLATSQNKMLAALEAETGEKWTITRTTSTVAFEQAKEALAKGDYEVAFIKMLMVMMFGDNEYAGYYSAKDNELLGVKTLTERELVRICLDQVAKA